MNKFRELLEAEPARIIRTANPKIVRRLKKDRPKLSAVPPPTGDYLFKKNKDLKPAPLTSQSEYIFKHKGRYVIDTNHAAQRMSERNSYSKKELDLFFKRMIEKYLSMGSKYTSLNNPEFLFFSKSLNQGMIIAYRKDYKRIDNNKHFVVVTFFPRGNKRAKPGTETILLESYDYGAGPVFSKAFVEYISCLRDEFGHPYECFLKDGQDYIPECIQLEDVQFDIIFCEGKLFNIADFQVIEID